ncbi:hypothetical protein [Nocardia wallacei]|uniref:hypothetical protein n=1 Tax=Nocardia wallacei TaxID=480035 RepID=UPI002454024F|nr:hypothetical protein [Nocardia wallacei]
MNVPAVARIRPAHAGNGWVYEQTDRGPQLVKDYGGYTARIRATAGTTCVWTIRGEDGSFREASDPDGIGAAKAAADEWVELRS